jgi:simple sugar transport system ATP-binding protein
VTKYYGDFAANKNVDFNIKPGEIHALLGENGAGKSTLVKMLYGSLQPTSGEIFWKGNPVTIISPSFARKLGVGMVFQHFSLFESLNVSENIALSLSSDKRLEEVTQEAVELSNKYGLPLNPDALVGDLSVGERQRVEIVRCLMQNPELIILDEPTSVLTPQEAERLFDTLDILKTEGRSILFISHRLEEVRRLCDRATILRFGEVSGACDPKQETSASIARMMVGNDVSSIKKTKSSTGENVLLNVENLSQPAATPFAVPLSDISLKISAGEVLGIAGIAGNGQSELFDAISGEVTALKPDTIRIRDHKVGHFTINQRRKLGASFVPEERLGHGAIADFHLSDNMLLARHKSDDVAFQKLGRIGVIWREMVDKATKRVCEVMDVRKADVDPLAGSLSGGNLQKFIIGRELDRQPSVLVINQPSWGVDAGAAAHIRQSIVDLARSGTAVLIISQDLDEIFELSDKIAVMFDGHLSQAMNAADTSREEIGLLMAGVDENEGKHAA